MILARNRQQRLNGNNKWLYLLLLLFTASSCGIFKGKNKPTTPKDVVDIEDTKPSVDTIEFESIPEVDFPPIKDPNDVTSDLDPFEAFKKEVYNLALFIPFEAKVTNASTEDISSLSASRFVNYYAGVKLGLEEIEKEGLSFNVKVFDSERSPEVVAQKINSIIKGGVDIIVGPYEREGLQVTAEYGKEHNIAVISPWLASTRVTDNNPFYVQLRPSLSSHYFKMINHIHQHFENDEIVLIGRDVDADKNRFRYFQKTYAALNNDPLDDTIQEFFVLEDSLSYGATAFNNLFVNGEKKAIIIPNWNYNDEDFIYSCLRRLNIEKGNAEIYVYGMPIIYDSEKMDFDFYKNLNIRMVLSEFTDWADPRVQDFERKYFQRFGDLPTSDAYEGFDMINFIGNNLLKYGLNFHLYLEEDNSRYLQTAYDIQKVYDENDEKFENIKYLENRHLDLIQYVDKQFRKID